MPKAHIEDGELRIPLTADMREKFRVQEGEELNAHVFAGSMTFTRAGKEARREAWDRIHSLIGSVEVRPGQPDMTGEEVNQMVDEEVKAYRRGRRA